MAFTDYIWTPLFTGFVVPESFGAGGGANIGGTTVFGAGPGGGAYGRRGSVAVTNGIGITVRIANQSPQQTNGDTTFFKDAPTCSAEGGRGASGGISGVGGKAVNSGGDVVYDGGDGYQTNIWPAPGQDGGGGGGSCADDSGPGNNGIYLLGGAARPRGGKGGDGGVQTNVTPPPWNGTPGIDGDAPGGGGGGGGYGNPSQTTGGKGGMGAVVIWAAADWPDAATPGTRPVVGAVPIAVYGAPVPPFPTPPVTVRSSSFVV